MRPDQLCTRLPNQTLYIYIFMSSSSVQNTGTVTIFTSVRKLKHPLGFWRTLWSTRYRVPYFRAHSVLRSINSGMSSIKIKCDVGTLSTFKRYMNSGRRFRSAHGVERRGITSGCCLERIHTHKELTKRSCPGLHPHHLVSYLPN